MCQIKWIKWSRPRKVEHQQITPMRLLQFNCSFLKHSVNDAPHANDREMSNWIWGHFLLHGQPLLSLLPSRKDGCVCQSGVKTISSRFLLLLRCTCYFTLYITHYLVADAGTGAFAILLSSQFEHNAL